MSGLNNLSMRINYLGGPRQQDRMNEDKLRSLKKALLYSYQAATAVFENGKEFRCLINPDKLKEDNDDKIISIPYKDICLNDPRTGKTWEGMTPTEIKAGSVFQWKENGSWWIIFLQRVEEIAYFRAEIRRCSNEVQIGKNTYHVWIKGPTQQGIDWLSKERVVFNTLNYTNVLMVTHTPETEAVLHRFTVLRINGKRWEVQAIDNTSTKGVIFAYLKEDYSNEIEDLHNEEVAARPPKPEIDKETTPFIDGKEEVYPYEIYTYYIKNIDGGVWKLNNRRAVIKEQTEEFVTIEIVTGRSGEIELSYIKDNGDIVLKHIKVLSLI